MLKRVSKALQYKRKSLKNVQAQKASQTRNIFKAMKK